MKILLATDGTEYSERAAKFLSGLQCSGDDEIVVLHALSWVPVISEWEMIYSDLKAIREEIAPQILEATVKSLSPVHAAISSLTVDGYPDKVILDTAADTGADLIVMGASGLRGAASVIVGSVTKAVAVKSTKPVLIIRGEQEKKTGPLKVLFAADGSICSEGMMKVLSSIPFPDDTEINVLNVVTTAFEDIPDRFAMEINDRIKGIVARARETEFKESEGINKKVSDYLGSRFSNIKKLTKIGDPSDEILNTAEALGADIIAVGNSGMRGLKGILGSVSRYILNHAKCSVLIGKPV